MGLQLILIKVRRKISFWLFCMVSELSSPPWHGSGQTRRRPTWEAGRRIENGTTTSLPASQKSQRCEDGPLKEDTSILHNSISLQLGMNLIVVSAVLVILLEVLLRKKRNPSLHVGSRQGTKTVNTLLCIFCQIPKQLRSYLLDAALVSSFWPI